MTDSLLEMPKAELHVHLEGSVEPGTLHELDPATPVEEFRALTRTPIRSLEGVRCRRQALRTPGGLRPGNASELLERLSAPECGLRRDHRGGGSHCCRKAAVRSRFRAVSAAPMESPVEVRWILDAVRRFGVERAVAVAAWRRSVGPGVVAFGSAATGGGSPAGMVYRGLRFRQERRPAPFAHAARAWALIGVGPRCNWAPTYRPRHCLGARPRLAGFLGDGTSRSRFRIVSDLVAGVVRASKIIRCGACSTPAWPSS